MIPEFFKKFVSYFLLIASLIVATFGNTYLFASAKAKPVEKENVLKNLSPASEEKFQCNSVEKAIAYELEAPRFKAPIPASTYREYDKQNTPLRGVPQSENVFFVVTSIASSAVVQPVIMDLNYTVTPDYTDIKDLNIDIADPKHFLARNLNTGWKEIAEERKNDA